MPRRENSYKTKHSGCQGARTKIKHSMLDAQSPEVLQNKAFWMHRRENSYKTKFWMPRSQNCNKTNILNAQALEPSILDARAPELLQNNAFWMPRRQNSYKTKILDAWAPKL
jgi:hypothetical protein